MTSRGYRMKPQDKKKRAPNGMRVVDMTPTWTGILPALFALLEAPNKEARDTARSEFARMARAADLYNAGRR